MKLAGCIIIYNPKCDVWSNINSYLNEIEKLYVLDNSEEYYNELIHKVKSSKKCQYINLRGNKGIAFALNIAVQRALNDQFHWLLTMDQDSFFTSDNLDKMKEYIESEKPENVKVVCPAFEDEKIKTRKYVLEMITSGSIMDVDFCNEIGGFDNKLFIDEVDHDYCVRVILKGCKVIKLNEARLTHFLGNQTFHNKIKCYNYPPIRYYYITRNNLYFHFKYRRYKELSSVIKLQIPRIKKIMVSIWFEENRYEKYLYMLLGLYDFLRKNMGKFKWFQSKNKKTVK